MKCNEGNCDFDRDDCCRDCEKVDNCDSACDWTDNCEQLKEAK